jgi:hypothetical protein
MSEYRVVESQIHDPKAIVAGLIALGIPKEAITVSKTPQPLYGYSGDLRKETAEIVVKRGAVDNYLSGGASNDLGFKKVDGKYQAVVSAYDEQRWWRDKKQVFLQESAADQARRTAINIGYDVFVTRTKDGKIILKCKK